MIRSLPLIMISVLINAGAQLLMKRAMQMIGPFELSTDYLFNFALSFITNAYLFSAVLCYVTSLVMWLVVLSRVDVSLAYPMLSVGYIVVAIAGYFLFAEALPWTRILGIIIIILGVWLMTYGVK